MKKITAVLVFVLALVLSACTKDDFGSKNIQVYTRDTASGTREAFFEILGNKEAIKDNSKVAANMIEVTSNGDMIAKVKADKYAIGYISLSSLEGSKVKGLNVGGFEPTIANVNSGKYTVTRNFNYMMRATFNSVEEQYLTEAFIAYMNSAEGKATIVSEGGIVDLTGSQPWNTVKGTLSSEIQAQLAKNNASITLNLGGSTSVEKIAIALGREFKALAGNVGVSNNHSGSGDAYKRTQGGDKDSANALHVGFLSREVDASGSEPAKQGTFGKLATDAIVIVVNQDNTQLTNVSKELLSKIFFKSDQSIKQEDLTHIYERFYRADESNIKQISGSGLGLAIVKHVAQTYKLKITVDSKKGIKTVFTINFN